MGILQDFAEHDTQKCQAAKKIREVDKYTASTTDIEQEY